MGASTERIALEVTSRADVGGLRTARDGLEALRQSTEQLAKSEDALGAETKKLTVDREAFNRALEKYGGDVQKAAAEAARLAAVEKEIGNVVAPTTRELEQQTTVLREQAVVMQRETTQALTALERRVASTSVAVVFGMESMVRGFAAGESGIRAALRSVSVLLATTMGAGGIAIGALIAFGDAAVEQFTRAGRAAEEMRKKIDEEMKRLVNAQDWAALQKQAQDLFEGTPAEHFRDGIKGLNQELANLRVRLKEAEAGGPLTMSLGIGGGTANTAAEGIRQQMATIEAEVKRRQARINQIMAEEVSLENVSSPRGGAKPFTIEESGRSALKQITLDMSVYADEIRNVLAEGTKLKDLQVGMIGQDQLTPLQLLVAEEGRLAMALKATNLTYSETIRLQGELARARAEEAEARKVINVDPKTIEKQAKEAMDIYNKSHQKSVDDDVALEAKKRIAAAARVGSEMASAALAGIRAHESLGKILSRMLLEPFERELEALAISEGAKAVVNAAALDFAGAARHAAAMAEALAGAAAVAALGGFGGGGGGGRGGGHGGGGGGTFTPQSEGAGAGTTTIVINTIDPTSKRVINSTTAQAQRAGTLKSPVYYVDAFPAR